MQVEELVVPADNSILEREEAKAASRIPRFPVLSINRRTAEIELESLRHQHCRGLHLETVGEDSGKSGRAGTLEVVEPPQKVLALQRSAMILEAAVERSHLVCHIGDRGPRREEVGSENHTSVFEPDLRVFELIAAGLLLFVLVASGEVRRQSGGKLLMRLEVSKADTEFPGRWCPDERSRNCVEAVVELRCAYTQRAQVVPDHSDVVQPVRDLAPGPNA